MARLDSGFFLRDTVKVAQDLLGRYLVRQWDGERIVCRITETEAYVGAVDKACHAYGGRMTERTRTLYAAPGTIYVYLIYGMYHCLNFVTEAEGTAAAVLIRGGEVVWGKERAANLRFQKDYEALTAAQRRSLANGPGKLCKALSVDRHLNGCHITGDALYLVDALPELSLPERLLSQPFLTGKRIGIDYAEEAVDFPWRFWLE